MLLLINLMWGKYMMVEKNVFNVMNISIGTGWAVSERVQGCSPLPPGEQWVLCWPCCPYSFYLYPVCARVTDAMFFPVPDLIMLERLTPGPTPLEEPPTCCCEHRETTKEWLLRRLRLLRKQHWWLDEQIVLPTPIKKGVMSCHTVVITNFSCLQGMLKLVNCWFTSSWTNQRPLKRRIW